MHRHAVSDRLGLGHQVTECRHEGRQQVRPHLEQLLQLSDPCLVLIALLVGLEQGMGSLQEGRLPQA